jgi:hypothetical protein
MYITSESGRLFAETEITHSEHAFDSYCTAHSALPDAGGLAIKTAYGSYKLA